MGKSLLLEDQAGGELHFRVNDSESRSQSVSGDSRLAVNDEQGMTYTEPNNN